MIKFPKQRVTDLNNSVLRMPTSLGRGSINDGVPVTDRDAVPRLFRRPGAVVTHGSVATEPGRRRAFVPPPGPGQSTTAPPVRLISVAVIVMAQSDAAKTAAFAVGTVRRVRPTRRGSHRGSG